MRAWLEDAAPVVAPRLLGCLVTSQVEGLEVVLRLTEVEAYAGIGDDPASHAHRGRTARNAAMFGEPGTAYVYFTYGMHWCLNVVVGPVGQAAAVLLRAGVVESGHPTARRRRTSGTGRAPSDRDLARGPARLCQALGVTGEADGLDLLAADSPVRLGLAEHAISSYESGPRVGVSQAADRPWRFWLPDEPSVSAYRGGTRQSRGKRRGG